MFYEKPRELGVIPRMQQGAAARFWSGIWVGAMLEEEPGHLGLFMIDGNPEGLTEGRALLGKARVCPVIEQHPDHLEIIAPGGRRKGPRVGGVLKVGQSGLAGERVAN